MATSVVVVSDLSGTPGARSYLITVGPTTYGIDLTDAEFAEYEAAVAPYVNAGRRIADRAPQAGLDVRPASGRRSSVETAAIKAWGRENGYTFSDRGRLPQELLNGFRQAHSG